MLRFKRAMGRACHHIKDHLRLSVAQASSMPIVASGAVVGMGLVGPHLWSKCDVVEKIDICQERSLLEQIAVRCPKLGGWPLPTPMLHHSSIGWKNGQEFSMKFDDPFRMEVTPPVPAFIENENPSERHRHIVKQELPVQGLELEKPMSPYQGDMIFTKTFCWVFDNVLTEEQCRELIQSSNQKGYVPALKGTSFKTKAKAGGDTLVFDPSFRDVYTVMYDSPKVTEWLFAALEPHLKVLPVPDGWCIDHLNSFVRSLCYCNAAQGHAPHFDAMMKYPGWKYPDGHPYKEARSYMTFMLYLSDMPPQSGGSTAFPKPGTEECDTDMRCCPKAGRVLIFSQNLYHSGSPIKDHIKYVFRSDVMCVPDNQTPSVQNLFRRLMLYLPFP